MTTAAPPFIKVRSLQAAEIAALYGPKRPIAALLTGTTADGVAALLEAGLSDDAVRFLAHALKPRQAVWWACLCARAALAEPTEEAQLAALVAAEAWVFQPSEDGRRACEAAADAAGRDNPQGWAATAAFWSGGSIVRPDLPEVPATPAMLGAAVAATVLLAGAADVKLAAEALAWGMDIARGGRGRSVAP